MPRHVVLGKGPLGTALAHHLSDHGQDVLVVSRSGAPAGMRDVPPGGVAHTAVDASDPVALTAAVRGAEVVYNCASPRYDRWPALWPALNAAALDAAEATGAVLVAAGNLYAYGRPDGPMTESTPTAPAERKGAVRAAVWDEALRRHRAGRVRVTEVRGSDYVGPGAVGPAHAGERLVRPLLQGRPLRPIGDPDVPHSWTYLPDFAAALAAAGRTAQAWGSPWIAPTGGPLTFRELATRLADAAGVDVPTIAPVPTAVLAAIGLASGPVREVRRMTFQFDAPFVVDSTGSQRVLGVDPTPWERIAAQTVAWGRGLEPAAGRR
ncbi:NAD-dependent epimerase/dehydratase family protein [Cellulomonas alba]|uniref:NAD-dependent epimerase/dehydratase family protein n=1 Tax=Cellulomonas alba TaxID=3053467 RepID=A0ABT7SDF8_9CELL|nr:NAD-dependent epimerase/dehydratase family protein [Cellulomonas alba]MDM7854229.1 NAD-dependent epimerase/dehydratase family protein [Cellulomonas alba]